MPPVSVSGISLPERYRVVRHVANGGMAGVWEAHDELLDRPVAVKLLAPHLSQDERARLRFQREARTAAGLSSHPHVVTIYDVGEHDGRSFIVMELMRGSVADRLRSGERADRGTALRWLREAASALDAAHERGVVHRDVKPANMLLDDKERLALGDFGIAFLATDEQLTLTGQVLGTAAYISPEQAMGRPASDASDRYSLAVVAYELLVGGRPFQAEHYAAQARAHVEDTPPPASERAPALPHGVDEVLDRGMAKDPAHRYLTASAFVGALDQALGSPAPSRVAAPVEPTVPFEPVAASGRPPTEEPPPRLVRRRRFPAGAVAALVALVLAGGALAAILLSGNGDGGGGQAEATPTPTATATATETAEPTAEATPEPTPEATAAPEETATPTPTPESENGGGTPDLERAAQLNDEGFRLFQNEDYDAAVEPLRGAVEACGDSTELNPCGFALYNLGASLNRSGNPEEAIPFLERRLEGGFEPNQEATVRRELRDARSKVQGS